MRILKFFTGFAFVLLFISFLVSSSIKIFLLNESYIISRLQSPGVYETLERGSKAFFRDVLKQQLSKQNDFSKLSTNQRREIEVAIEKFLEPVNRKNISDFIENNIISIYAYLNGETDLLNIYFPVKSWGMPDDMLSQIPFEEFDGDYIDIKRFAVNHPENNIDLVSLNRINHLGNSLWIATVSILVLMAFLIVFYALLSSKESRPNSIGVLFSVTGFFSLIFSWLAFSITRLFAQSIEIKRDATDLIAGAIIPAVFKGVILYWVGLSIVVLLLGIYFFNKHKSQKAV